MAVGRNTKLVKKKRSGFRYRNRLACKKMRHNSSSIIPGVTLDDMIETAIVLDSQKSGIPYDVEIDPEKVNMIISTLKSRDKSGTKTTEELLSRAIVRQNKIENKPTQETRELYKKVFGSN